MTNLDEKKIELLMGIRARMWARGILQKDVAREIGVNQSMVSHVLNGRKNSARVMDQIKTMLNQRVKKASQN